MHSLVSNWPRSSLTALALTFAVVQARTGDWPHWRGPQRNGISTETGWTDQWPPTGPRLLWKAEVGTGFASFAVAQGRLYTSGNRNNVDTIFCFDAENGKPLWQHSYDADIGDKYFDGGTAATPTFDEGRLYTLSRWGDVFCFDAQSGSVLWSKNIQKEANIRIPGWGFCGSPLVLGNRLLLNVGEGGVALDKTTGQILWRSANKEAGYSTPLPIQRDGKTLILLASGQAYLAVDLESGREIWRYRWMTQFGVNASDPIVHNDHIFISTGYGKGAALLKWNQSSDPETVWKSKSMRNQFHSSVLIDGFLYGIDGDTDRAGLKCVEFATGNEMWTEPSVGAGALTAANGKLIVLSELGELMIAPAKSEAFKPSARAQVIGGKCWTSPVLANGRIYCRNARGHIVCVGGMADSQ